MRVSPVKRSARYQRDFIHTRTPLAPFLTPKLPRIQSRERKKSVRYLARLQKKIAFNSLAQSCAEHERAKKCKEIVQDDPTPRRNRNCEIDHPKPTFDRSNYGQGFGRRPVATFSILRTFSGGPTHVKMPRKFLMIN